MEDNLIMEVMEVQEDIRILQLFHPMEVVNLLMEEAVLPQIKGMEVLLLPLHLLLCMEVEPLPSIIQRQPCHPCLTQRILPILGGTNNGNILNILTMLKTQG